MKMCKIGLVVAMLVLLPMLAIEAADPPVAKNEQKAAKDGTKESSRVRYARAYVALARLDLQTAQDRNKQVADTIPPGLILELEAQVALTEKWLQEADKESQGEHVNIAAETAEIYVKVAEANYARALEANRIAPMAASKLARLKLKVELAHLNRAAAKEIDPQSSEAQLNFVVDRLREEVTALRVRQLEILDRN